MITLWLFQQVCYPKFWSCQVYIFESKFIWISKFKRKLPWTIILNFSKYFFWIYQTRSQWMINNKYYHSSSYVQSSEARIGRSIFINSLFVMCRVFILCVPHLFFCCIQKNKILFWKLIVIHCKNEHIILRIWSSESF